MKKPTNDEVKKLVREIVIPFSLIERDMTIPLESGYRQENDAEHSWSVALVACALAPHIDPTLDIGLVSQYALVHDLVEIYASDVSIWADDDTLSQKDENERKALEVIKQKYSHFPWLVQTIETYEKQDSNEALYVRSIDKYVPLILRSFEEGRYFKERGITKEIFDKGIALPRMKAHGHKAAAEYYDVMLEEYYAHPEHFAAGGVNTQKE